LLSVVRRVEVVCENKGFTADCILCAIELETVGL
jgi:hypothetical protein